MWQKIEGREELVFYAKASGVTKIGSVFLLKYEICNDATYRRKSTNGSFPKKCFTNSRRYINDTYFYKKKNGFKYFPVYKKIVYLTNVIVIFPPQNYSSPIKININNHPLVV